NIFFYSSKLPSEPNFYKIFLSVFLCSFKFYYPYHFRELFLNQKFSKIIFFSQPLTIQQKS
ncbi:hypothetical protein M153_87440001031, partial [Pseudoloma neurophilia]